MAVPGFSDPATAALPPGGDLYFAPAAALKAPAESIAGGHGGSVRGWDRPELMFGEDEGKFAGNGEAVRGPAVGHAAKNSWREVLNWRGSPSLWILLGILLVVGILSVHVGAGGRVGSRRFKAGIEL